MKIIKIVPLLIIVASFAVGIYFYPQMPDQVASHWNTQGQVNGYMSKFWGMFLMPLLSVFMYLLFLIIPELDPKAENIKKFRGNFDNFIATIFAFFFYIFILTILWNLDIRFNFTAFIVPAFAALFYMIGTLVEKAEPNWSIGIRTPWTLSNENVWRVTHALGGKLFRLVAIISLSSLLVPKYSFWVVIISVISSTLYLLVHSYFSYRKEIKK
ncbi:MAG: DUF1648 domain-containing protein [Candidatus Pacebacteria bacterium]|nr:DUF1648 domain-containing protein [Candidatus Paceibacterota bacterium]